MSEQHVISVRTNWTIYFILLGLLVLTIVVSIPDLGVMAVSVAMAIATVKAVLILLYFMHVKFSKSLVWIFSTAAFFWMIIMVVLMLSDYYSRDWLNVLGK